MKQLTSAFDDEIVGIITELGNTVERWDRNAIQKELKSDNSIVTEGDHYISREISEFLQKSFPEDGILSEEAPAIFSKSGAFWVLDPIDGTTLYAEGKPHYRILLARVEEGRATLGAMYFPALGEFIYGRKGIGCFRNGSPVRVSSSTSLKAEKLFTSNPEAIATPTAWSGGSYPTESGIAVLGLITGTVDGIVVPITTHKLWDVAAFFALIEEAGGRVSSSEGGAPVFDLDEKVSFYGQTHQKPVAVASNGLIHEALIAKVKLHPG